MGLDEEFLSYKQLLLYCLGQPELLNQNFHEFVRYFRVQLWSVQ